MTQRAIVIAGFPGIGKSSLTNPNIRKHSSLASYDFLDLDTSGWSHTGGRPNPSFPLNYIDHIRRAHLETRNLVILVGVHDVVRDQLLAEGIRFTLVYPEKDLKGEYTRRWVERGSPAGFVQKLSSMWDSFTSSCAAQVGCNHVVLREGMYLADVMEGILEGEGASS